MQYIAEGQVSFISDRTVYDKHGNEMVTVVLSLPNQIIKGRMELVKFDFIKSYAIIPEELNVSVGDMVQIIFQLVGRKWKSDKGKTEYFINLQGLSISYI